jgi:hypothetical protein
MPLHLPFYIAKVDVFVRRLTGSDETMKSNGPWDAFTSGLWAVAATIYLSATAIFQFQQKKSDL